MREGLLSLVIEELEGAGISASFDTSDEMNGQDVSYETGEWSHRRSKAK